MFSCSPPLDFCNGTILERLSLRAICDFENMFGECQQKIPPGTVIQVNCAYGYSRESNTPQNLMCLPDGNFDQVPVSCKQQCGQFPSSTPFLTKNGIEIVSSKAPWHVGIYMQDDMEYHYVCAGSIISPTVVISGTNFACSEAAFLIKMLFLYQPHTVFGMKQIAGQTIRQIFM